MSDDKRNTVDPTAPLTHADAEALISARLDGPLDPVMNRALLAHLATCDSCRAFAGEMDMMATAFRDFPSLPPSTAVTRAVRAEIRGGNSPMRKFGRWVRTSKSAPITALGGAAIALALVTASVFGTLRDDDNNTPSVGAPGVAQSGNPTASTSAQTLPTETGEADTDNSRYTPPLTATVPNVTAPPTQTPEPAAPTDEATEAPTSSAPSAAVNSTTQEDGGADLTETAKVTDPTSAAAGAAPADEAATSEPTSEPTFDTASENTPEAIETVAPTETPTEEATSTPEPTETPTEEPTALPTETPTAEPTPTEEPAPTETPTEEPTATPAEDTTAAIVANDSTPEASVTPTPEPGSPTPGAPTPTPAISPRDGQPDDETPDETPTEEATQTEQVEQVDETPTEVVEEPTVEEGQGSADGESPPIQPSDGNSAEPDDTGAVDEVTPEGDGAAAENSTLAQDESTPEPGGQGGETVESSVVQSGPLNFGDLASADYSVASFGTYLPGPGGQYAAEQPGGGLKIVTGQGEIQTNAYGYNPVWSSDGTLYSAGGAISEGSSALNNWSGGDNPDFTTSGEYLDVPAGDGSGGFYYVRQLPGTSTLELRVVGSDEVIWTQDGFNLAAQSIYIYSDVVYIPTDQGWLAVTTSGDMNPLGSAVQFTYDLLLDSNSGQVAYVDQDGNVYVGSASDPSSASPIGSIGGNGSIAWTSYGLAIASGDTVTINGVPVVENGSDLTALVWDGSNLYVADAGSGGEVRIITDAEIQQALTQ